MAQLALVLFFRRDSKLNVTEGEASAVFYFSLETVPLFSSGSHHLSSSVSALSSAASERCSASLKHACL